MSPRRPVVVIHGGTGWHRGQRQLTRVRQSLRAISRAAYDYLQTHSACDSAVFAVRLLEDDPLFNAGTGSALQQDGRARMSAAVMDGHARRFAAVVNIERVRNPIVVARALLDQPDRVLAGPEATGFARSLSLPAWNPITALRLRQWRQRKRGTHGTVGALALDQRGFLAAATSTGGKGFERPGRVSDSGLPVGTYAAREVAISCTGIGEDILEEGLAVRIAEHVRHGHSLAETVRAIQRGLRRDRRRAGAITLDHQGHVAWMTTLPILLAVAQTPRRRVESF